MPRFALTAPREYEQDLHEATAKLLRTILKPPAVFQCIDSGALELTRASAAKLARMGVQAGWPDFLVLHWGAFGIELKRPGGKLTEPLIYRTRKGILRLRPGQSEVFPLLIRAGMQIRVCFTLPDVVQALTDWQIPHRGTQESERPPERKAGGRLSELRPTTTNQGK